MKVSFNHILIILWAVLLLFLPVAAVSTGNASGVVHPSGTIQTPYPTPVITTSPPIALPSIAIPQNVGFVPIWLALGIILIIIALAGLLWRYFHPKYVAPEDHE
jgi:hypothetical protein